MSANIDTCYLGINRLVRNLEKCEVVRGRQQEQLRGDFRKKNNFVEVTSRKNILHHIYT